MTYPNSLYIPGNKPMIIGQFVELCRFEAPYHYQFTLHLTALQAGESIEIRYYTKSLQTGLWYLEEPPVTFGPGPFPGTFLNNRENYTIDFIAAQGIYVEAKQTGGTARTLEWDMVKV